jgi:hypothetical protein
VSFVVLGRAQRVALWPITAQPLDQANAGRQELGVRCVADALEQLHRRDGLGAQIGQDRAAELLVRNTAGGAIAGMLVVAALQPVLRALAEELDTLIDRLVPMRGEHRPEKVDAREDGGLIELVREVDAELAEAVGVLVVAERAAQ